MYTNQLSFLLRWQNNNQFDLIRISASAFFTLVTSGLELEVIREACECDFVVKLQQTELSCAHSASFVDCAAAVWLLGLFEDLLLAQISQTRRFGWYFDVLTTSRGGN